MWCAFKTPEFGGFKSLFFISARKDKIKYEILRGSEIHLTAETGLSL